MTRGRVPFEAEAGEASNIFSKETNNIAIAEQYSKIQSPPALAQLDVFRDDNKSCLGLYTNPNFFIGELKQE